MDKIDSRHNRSIPACITLTSQIETILKNPPVSAVNFKQIMGKIASEKTILSNLLISLEEIRKNSGFSAPPVMHGVEKSVNEWKESHFVPTLLLLDAISKELKDAYETMNPPRLTEFTTKLLKHMRYERKDMEDETKIPPYNRSAYPVNEDTLVKLSNGEAYPANYVDPLNTSNRVVVSESPKNGDGKYYYEMVWNANSPTLISAARITNDEGQFDRAQFDFVPPGTVEEYTMTNGGKLRVKCLPPREEKMGLEHRVLKLRHNGQVRRSSQWVFNPDAFDYNTNGLRSIKYILNSINFNNVIVNCTTGIDRSAAVIMWLQIFQKLYDGSLKVEEITHDYLGKVAEEFEKQSTEGGLVQHVKETITLSKYNMETDEKLQNAVRDALAN